MGHEWLLEYLGPCSPEREYWLKIWVCRKCAIRQSATFRPERDDSKLLEPDQTISQCQGFRRVLWLLGADS